MDLLDYNSSLTTSDQLICEKLFLVINENLIYSENKLWHSHPVWFINGNPIVGYSRQKAGVRLMFWSGLDFEEDDLNIKGLKFKDASIFYKDVLEINEEDLIRWLKKSEQIQWDYKNLIKRKGKLEKLETK